MVFNMPPRDAAAGKALALVRGPSVLSPPWASRELGDSP